MPHPCVKRITKLTILTLSRHFNGSGLIEYGNGTQLSLQSLPNAALVSQVTVASSDSKKPENATFIGVHVPLVDRNGSDTIEPAKIQESECAEICPSNSANQKAGVLYLRGPSAIVTRILKTRFLNSVLLSNIQLCLL